MTNFQRIAGLSGFAALALWAVAFVTVPSPPWFGTPAEIETFAGESRGALMLSVYVLDVLPGLAFLVAGVGLWHATRDAVGWSTVVLVALVVWGNGILVWTFTDILFLNQVKRDADPAAFAFTYDLFNAVHAPVHSAMALLVISHTLALRQLASAGRIRMAATGAIAVANVAVISAAWWQASLLEAVHVSAIIGFLVWFGFECSHLVRAQSPQALSESVTGRPDRATSH